MPTTFIPDHTRHTTENKSSSATLHRLPCMLKILALKAKSDSEGTWVMATSGLMTHGAKYLPVPPSLSVSSFSYCSTRPLKDTLLPVPSVNVSCTLWCGFGQTAQDMAELGAWGPVDHCCRLHDLCPVQLPSYVYYRGAINTTPKPMSHCRCDLQFSVCLSKIKNRAATIVFHTYFNLLFRGGFCATVQPRTPRIGFSRAFGNLWTQIATLLRSWTGFRKHKRARRKRTTNASITTLTSSHHPSTTATPRMSIIQPPQTTQFSSSFSYSFQTVDITSIVQRTTPKTTQEPESPSPPLELTTDTCILHHLTPHLSADITKESIHTTPSSSSQTPPLHHIRQPNETPLQSENTLEKNVQESDFPWHEQGTKRTSEKRPGVSSILIHDNLTLLIMSFRKYLEEMAAEMEEMEKEEEGKEIAEEEEEEE
ncbi:uncharacterized protein LOC123515150 isoform X2 [Portunus trituberculatus]|uniref:uncharacterized protein LOC123515150 isoform X2 n=1 Tax=Portunus trituberculatus TaxID=210409 RepID=UPI001E1D1AEB|nr:uncharacterized protein LOC123515150 isoform X2 [Portunus trituberculatus]